MTRKEKLNKPTASGGPSTCSRIIRSFSSSTTTASSPDPSINIVSCSLKAEGTFTGLFSMFHLSSSSWYGYGDFNVVLRGVFFCGENTCADAIMLIRSERRDRADVRGVDKSAARISLGGYSNLNRFLCISISEPFVSGTVGSCPNSGTTSHPSIVTPLAPLTTRNA